jgi:uncharacterized protein (DUF58 family)
MATKENSAHAFLDPRMLARLAHLPLVSRQAMEGNITGQHKSPHRGSSVEFAEYRGYVAGDDLRRLDWRVLGRTDRYFIKEFEADTNLRLHLLVDASASMGFIGRGPRKFDCAQAIAGALAHLAARQGDAAGLNCVSEKHRIELPARRNPSHLQTIFDLLAKTEPAGATSLPVALHELAEKIRRRALVVVISDFFCPLEELKSCLQHLRFQKHDVSVFHLLDPLETSFEFDRPMRFQDLESPFSLVTEPAIVRDLYLEEFNRHREGFRSACLEFNVDYREVLTDANLEKILADFLSERIHAGGTR